MLRPGLYVVLLLESILYSFVHRPENTSSAARALRFPLMQVQIFVALALFEED